MCLSVGVRVYCVFNLGASPVNLLGKCFCQVSCSVLEVTQDRGHQDAPGLRMEVLALNCCHTCLLTAVTRWIPSRRNPG